MNPVGIALDTVEIDLLKRKVSHFQQLVNLRFPLKGVKGFRCSEVEFEPVSSGLIDFSVNIN